MEYVKNQLSADCAAMSAGKGCSLLAKRMPSINTSSKKACDIAKRFRKILGWSEKEYRQKLSALRGLIDVVEKKICDGRWSDIDYSAVPSKANLVYRNAFMHHDVDRRCEFLHKLRNGEEKINASVAFPHDRCSRRFLQHAFSRK